MNNEALKLLSRRERSDVLGHRYSNLWLLTAVITVTLLSIAFGNASMQYLTAKMDDPFTNWVSIQFDGKLGGGLEEDLKSEEFLNRYQIQSTQFDFNNSTYVFARESSNVLSVSSRYFNQFSGALVQAILSADNIVGRQVLHVEDIPERSLGVIITAEALGILGYDASHAPSYIYLRELSTGADTLGVEVTSDGYAHVPVPLLAVVKKLPDNVDLIASAEFYKQERSVTFDMSNPEYQRQLIYFVPQASCKEFKDNVRSAMQCEVHPYDELITYMKCYRAGHFFQVYPASGETIESYQATAKTINEKWAKAGAVRIYNYDRTNKDEQSFKDYLSINFQRLDSIRAFEQYMRVTYNKKIDITQVSTKENFNAVSWLANVLSWAMIVFAIICIILFIVNMMQSYFQKVKRNMGTFKAFGISIDSLIWVYVKMLFAIVGTAVLLALAISWALELLLPCLGVVREGGFGYLMLWNAETLASIIVILLATVITVYLVMRSLLRRTPGDLIYDR